MLVKQDAFYLYCWACKELIEYCWDQAKMTEKEILYDMDVENRKPCPKCGGVLTVEA